MSKFFFSLAVLALALGGCAPKADSQPAASPKVTAKDVLPNPYFFSATKGERKVFLFGTLHVEVALEDIPDFVISKLLTSPKFAAEKIYSIPHAPENELPDLKPLPLEPSTVKAWHERGLSDAALQFFSTTPFACEAYREPELLEKYLNRKIKIVDQQLEDVAVASHKRLLQLDDDALHARIMLSMNKPCDLNATVKKYPPAAARARALHHDELKEYRAGSLSTVNEADDATDTTMVAERNRIWVRLFEADTSPGATFAAFGAGHLGGKGGVLNLLYLQGWQIARVTGQDQSQLITKFE